RHLPWNRRVAVCRVVLDLTRYSSPTCSAIVFLDRPFPRRIQNHRRLLEFIFLLIGREITESHLDAVPTAVFDQCDRLNLGVRLANHARQRPSIDNPRGPEKLQEGAVEFLETGSRDA